MIKTFGKCLDLVISNGTLSENTTLVARSSAFVTFNQDNHPNVKYWGKHSWTKRRNDNDNLNVGRGLKHLKHSDGRLITTLKGYQICETARRTLNQVQLNNPNTLPAKWNSAGIDLVRAISAELRKEHPIFGLCKNDWKARTFLREFYPNWTQPKRNSMADDIKEEEAKDLTTLSRKQDLEDSDVEDIQAIKKARLAAKAKDKKCVRKLKVCHTKSL